MRKTKIALIILALALILIGILLFKNQKQLNKVENVFFDVAISNTISKYNIYSVEETLNEIIQRKVVDVGQDGSSYLERDIETAQSAYQELYQYYVAYSDEQIENNFQETLQEFRTFFDYLGLHNKDDIIRSDESDDSFLLPLSSEALVGVELIATMMKELETIRHEVYKDKATNDKKAWKALIIKNEDYIQTDEVQQSREEIGQFIKKWSE